MFCRHCGNELPNEYAVACMNCGCDPRTGIAYCPFCGSQVNEQQIVCVKCGSYLNSQPAYPGAPPAQRSAVDRTTAGLLAILLGIGIHQFYMGNTKSGVLHLVVSFATCGVGTIISLIEGIKYLSMSDEEFYYTYILNKKDWF